MSEKNRKKSEFLKFIILFGFLCVFFYFVPYTDDDLRWGSQTGLDRLTDGFAGYGGRYLGYLIVMGMTRSTVFKTLFMSGIVILMACLIQYVTRLSIAPYVVVLSVMLAPLTLFSSTIGWVSGFANYVTSICSTLVYVSYVMSFERSDNKKKSLGMLIPMLLLGMINTLIVEHFTIYNILLGVGVVIFYAVKYKQLFVQFIGYIVGGIVGASWMFSNSAYHNILAGSDSYRDVGAGSVLKTIGTGLAKICKLGYMDNIILNCAIFVMLYLVVSKYKDTLELSKQNLAKNCLKVNLTSIIASMFLAKLLEESDSVHVSVYLVIIALSLLSMLALFVIAVLFAKCHDCFKVMVFLLISIVILDGPFLIVNPVTPRVFFGTYILFTILLCLLIKHLCDEWKIFSEQSVVKFVRIGVSVGAIFYIIVFAMIYKADCERLSDIKRQVQAGSDKVIMYSLPYEHFVHDITLYEKWELKGYKQFYHLPSDLELVVEDEEKDE